MSQSALHGSCLCGEVTFKIEPPFERMVHCHCSRCRKGGGSGHGTNLITQAEQLTYLSGEQHVRHYDHASAKSFGKWFCGQCGSPLPRLTRNGQLAVIPAGSLDSVQPIKPTDHIFWASRAEWSCASGGLPTHDTYPPSWMATGGKS